jgi:Putative restriction endonuclease
MNDQAEDSGSALELCPPEVIPNLDDLVIEDGKPLDSIFTEKQQHLLTEPLYSSWAGPGEGQTFLALANVGLFHTSGEPPLVPDAMLAVDVRIGQDLSVRENRSYFVWLRGKVPDVVIEIVSDRRGGEATHKMRTYARIGVP